MNVANNLSATDADSPSKQGIGPDTTTCYFPRRLRFEDPQGQMHQTDESAMLVLPGPKIVLGEPGMGKSRLIAELGQRLGVQPIPAVRFLHHKNPGRLVIAGKPLLIDGLDEAMARRDGDAIDMILAQLEEAGAPDFILSCRAREWQERTVTNLRQIYSAEPAIFTLEALNRKEASVFLAQRYAKADAEHVLNHLDEHGIPELYSNPLTLGLMGRVAERDTKLPETRAALFERVCMLLWPEHDPDRQDIGLGKITQDQALSGAGAIMAGLLLAGGDVVSLVGGEQLQDGDVCLGDLETLPGAGAGAARAIFSSKLFYSVGVNRAKPIHRVIAEFLGAHWLAKHTKIARSQRRLLCQLQGCGAVPASLRGLHAWLAFHSSPMAIPVITADPFGVLRYGETASLTAEQADCMFDALEAIAKLDPYFRAQDWNSHSATGLMKPNLRVKIETTIASAQSNGHFRSLLIEGLKDTPLAADLVNTLKAVMFSTDRFYREREDAAEGLMPSCNREWWQNAITILHDQGTDDSTRLARNLIEKIDCDVTDQLLVATILGEMGITVCPLPRAAVRHDLTLRHYQRIVDILPTARLINVLDLLSEHAFLVDDADWQSANDLAEIVSLLFVRAIDEKVAVPENAALAWNWLAVLRHADRFHRDTKILLQVRLAAMIGPELMRSDIQRITEADMPKTKRADLAFARGQLQLPMEVKGQWHSEVWEAATNQLDRKYLIDWRSEQRGIYCVLWFGDLPSSSGRRLQVPPLGLKTPSSPDEMRKMLIESIPEARRAMIDVVVLDLTAGKP